MTTKSQVEIVENAGRLAADLQGSGVESKSAFLSIVATFMSDLSNDVKRLGRMMALLKDGSGGHLNRGGGFGDQVRAVIREVERLLDREEWQPEELKSLFGWTARLLQVRQTPRDQGGRGPRVAADSRQEARRPDRPVRSSRDQRSPEKKEAAARPGKPLGALSGKNLEELKAFGEKLSKPGDGKSS